MHVTVSYSKQDGAGSVAALADAICWSLDGRQSGSMLDPMPRLVTKGSDCKPTEPTGGMLGNPIKFPVERHLPPADVMI